MSVKKVFAVLGLLIIIGAFYIVPFGTVEAKHPTRPPVCVPIEFFDKGYWGVYCTDPDYDIVSAQLTTNSSNSSLIWDNTYAQMIVELDYNTTISWSVCDFAGNCVGNSFK